MSDTMDANTGPSGAPLGPTWAIPDTTPAPSAAAGYPATGQEQAPAADPYSVLPDRLPSDVAILTDAPGADFTPEAGKTYLRLDAKAPEMSAAREWARNNGVSPQAFNDLLGIAAKAFGARTPTPEAQAAEAELFFRSLGADGRARAGRVWNQLEQTLGQQDASALDAAITDRHAFAAIERLLAARAGGTSSAASSAAPGGLTEAKLQEMMRDPRYRDPMRRDPAFVQQVTEGWRVLYPEPPEGAVPMLLARRR